MGRPERASSRPGVARSGQDSVEQGHERARSTASDQSGPLVRNRRNCTKAAPAATRSAEEDPARARVGRRLRIGDHEEGEDQERAALEPMERDRQRLAEPERAAEEERERRSRERRASRRSRDAPDDEAARGTRAGTRRRPRCPTGRARPRRRPVASMAATMPKLVGLKTCLPRQRSTNLLAIAAAAASSGEPRRSWSAAAGRARGRRSGRSSGRRRGAGRRACRRTASPSAAAEEQRRASRRDVEVERREAVEKERRQGADLVEPGIAESARIPIAAGGLRSLRSRREGTPSRPRGSRVGARISSRKSTARDVRSLLSIRSPSARSRRTSRRSGARG